MQARACDHNLLRETRVTTNNDQPMSQKQADALRQEWALLLKLGYASQWTPAQKMARQDEITALLLQAGQALPRALTQQEFLASAREVEEALLMACLEIARSLRNMPCTAKEANVMCVAAMVISNGFPVSKKRLMEAAARYFEVHADEKVETAEVVRRGWVLNLPRLRDRLERKLQAAGAQ